jgi:glyoxylase-like metal-dependent hydrolase (beta-lactamase superfamily II)
VSEPKAVAERVEEVVPGVCSWHVHDDRINFLSAAHAVSSGDGVVLVDPLPLAEAALRALGEVTAIVLTSGSHQRSGWRLRRELDVPVSAPALSRQIDEEPDVRYGEGDRLPGGLTPLFTPGAGTTQHTLLTEGEPPVVIVSDLLVRAPGRSVELIPDKYAHDPAQARASIRRLLELDFDTLCMGHGQPLREGAKDAVRRALGES